MSELLDRVLDGGSLSTEEADEVFVALSSGEMEPAASAALLAGLRAKGETAEEVAGFAAAMRRLAVDPGIDGSGAVDVVGTGGDGSGSFNLSTGSALLAAAAGARVVKHGNRSVSSRSGSADVLEHLGVPMPMEPDQAKGMLERTGFTFLFAPRYHPAMKEVVPVRKAMGVRTVFNLLGPLTNPARPDHFVIGAWSEGIARLMANALAALRVPRAFVVHGAHGWDEPTTMGEFLLFDVAGDAVTETARDPGDLGFAVAKPEDLAGGDPADNAAALRAVFGGEKGPHRDSVVLGAGLALEVTGLAGDAEAGRERAEAAIDSGAATKLLEELE